MQGFGVKYFHWFIVCNIQSNMVGNGARDERLRLCFIFSRYYFVKGSRMIIKLPSDRLLKVDFQSSGDISPFL